MTTTQTPEARTAVASIPEHVGKKRTRTYYQAASRLIGGDGSWYKCGSRRDSIAEAQSDIKESLRICNGGTFMAGFVAISFGEAKDKREYKISLVVEEMETVAHYPVPPAPPVTKPPRGKWRLFRCPSCGQEQETRTAPTCCGVKSKAINPA